MKSLHGKLAWSFLKQESLWAKFAKSRFTVDKLGSPIWNSIRNHVAYLRRKSFWEVGNGNEEIEKFLWHYGVACNSEFAGLSIKEVLTHPARRFTFLCAVPEEAKEYYRNADFNEGHNSLQWVDSPNGVFSGKKYLQIRRKQFPVIKWGDTIWQGWLPPNFSVFTWRMLHTGLPTDDNVRRMGVAIASKCSCCGRKGESLNHLFFEGAWAMELWNLLGNIFQCRKPKDRTDLIRDWIEPNRKGDASSNLRMGLAMVGLQYIWKLRNNIRHEEGGAFRVYEVHKWAGYLINLIPKINDDGRSFQCIMMALRIPQDFRSTIEGKWACWRPDSQGNVMDVWVQEAENKSAILIRDNKGDFVLADRMDAHIILNDKDLEKMFVEWIRRVNIKIVKIRCAHHFTDMNGKNWRTRNNMIRVDKVHPWILHAVESVYYTMDMRDPVTTSTNLSKATRRAIERDMRNSWIFCIEGDREISKPRSISHSDDNLTRRPNIPRNLFRDDTVT